MKWIERALAEWREQPALFALGSIAAYISGSMLSAVIWTGLPRWIGKTWWLAGPTVIFALVLVCGSVVAFFVSIYFGFKKMSRVIPSSDPAVWDDKIPKSGNSQTDGKHKSSS